MAPLYKRYIPPKSSAALAPAAPAIAAPVSSPKETFASAAQDDPKKRKRERTDEEIAERKAKKLKKKGIDPATVVHSQAPPSTQEAKSGAEQVESTIGNAEPSILEPQGEFAHIKNTKKRHKLEKEARKVRQAAEKAQRASGATATLNGVESTHDEEGGEQQDNAEVEPTDSQQESQSSNTASKAEVKRSKRRKDNDTKATDDVQSSQAAASPETAVSSEQKEKKSKRRDKDAETEPEPKDEPVKTESQYDEAHSRPKKRRHKLESALQEPQTEVEGQPANDQEYWKKHGKVLSKFQKSAQISQSAQQADVHDEQPERPKATVLDLAPLPQPERVPTPEFVPDMSALPSWVANPTVVSSDSRSTFSDLNLEVKTVEQLSKLGFADSLPVQQGLIPTLLPPGTSGSKHLPGTERILPDLAVGAPTGSGKTIAYLLPIIESLKKKPGAGRLRALVVVPTRELVMQVAAVAESLAQGSSIRVAVATGAGAFKEEQSKIVKHGRRHNPAEYKRLVEKAHQRNYPPTRDSAAIEGYLDAMEEQDLKEEQHIRNTVAGLVDHVPTYESSVDIIVATPGRLLEHLNSTLGFTLAHLEWLVLDEADKLLDLQYDGFLQTVNSELSRPHREDEQDAREHYLHAVSSWDETRERRARKVVLSATMTKDISKLVELKLKHPQMIIVRSGEQEDAASRTNGLPDSVKEIGGGFELPSTLSEYCVPVGDGSEKPLYLVELLRNNVLPSSGSNSAPAADRPSQHTKGANASDAESSVSSDSSSDTESDSSTSSSELSTSSEETSDADEETNNTKNESSKPKDPNTMHPQRTLMLDTAASTPPTILIFTSSTESANRLSHLLKTLQPDWAAWITTMTKADRKKPQHSTTPSITISTDRAARGLDALPGNRSISHVIQYDVPRSATSYVHRVGRTARAGRRGEAWTLYSHSEARWFVKEVARAGRISRVGGVEKVRVGVEGVGGLRERLGEVVGGMREEVLKKGGR